jgi:hypothetical protein
MRHSQSSNPILFSQINDQIPHTRQQVKMLCAIGKRNVRKKGQEPLYLKFQLLSQFLYSDSTKEVAYHKWFPVSVQTKVFPEVPPSIRQGTFASEQTVPFNKTPVKANLQARILPCQGDGRLRLRGIDEKACTSDDANLMRVQDPLVYLGGKTKVICSNDQFSSYFIQSSNLGASMPQVQASQG